jgi:flagella basal body P-ring formation protein FlgA
MNKMKRLFLIMGCTFTTGLIAQATEPITVHVRSEAQIAEGNVVLGAVSRIESTDQERVKMLENLILGESPKAGKAVVWTAAEFSKRLRPYTQALQGARLRMPDKITIRREDRSWTREKLKRSIEDALRERTLPDPSWEVSVVELQWPQPGVVPPSDGSVLVIPPLTRPRGSANLEVHFIKNGVVTKKVWVAATVKYFAQMPFAQHSLRAGQTITTEDVTWKRQEVTYASDNSVSREELGTVRARYNITAGQSISRIQIEREPALRFGEEITVIAGDEALSVSTKGVAQQSGFIGDIIKIRSDKLPKALSAKVVAKGVVRVAY